MGKGIILGGILIASLATTGTVLYINKEPITINGYEINDTTTEELVTNIASDYSDTPIKVTIFDGDKTAVVDDITLRDLRSEIDLKQIQENINSIKQDINKILNGVVYFGDRTKEVNPTILNLNTALMQLELQNQKILDEDILAHIDNITDSVFTIKDLDIFYNEELGMYSLENMNPVDSEKLLDIIKEQILKSNTDIIVDLKQENLFIDFTRDEKYTELVSAIDNLNKYLSTNISFIFQGEDDKEENIRTEVLGKDTIKKMLSIDNGSVLIDNTELENYIDMLVSKYNTMGMKRTLKCSDGEERNITPGDYGWWIDYQETKKLINEKLTNHEDYSGKLPYKQTANSYGVNDYGDSYVEINLTNQHMWLYIDGKLIIETDIVSGNPNTGHATPVGAYSTTYTQRDATLTGDNYRTPVDYWMPFNKDVGIHDSSWQSVYGDNRYLTHGSHGCINTPPDKAAIFFKYLKKDFPVLLYKE